MVFALFLRQVAEVVAGHLRIYNQSLDTETVPLAWKLSNVTPVHKGRDTKFPGNLCPISVAPIVVKVLEKVIANQFLENHHLLDDLQGYGSCVEEQLCQAPELNQSIN